MSVPQVAAAGVGAGVAATQGAAVQIVPAPETSSHAPTGITSAQLPESVAAGSDGNATATNTEEGSTSGAEAEADAAGLKRHDVLDAAIPASTTATSTLTDLDLNTSLPPPSDNLRSYATPATTASPLDTTSPPASSPSVSPSSTPYAPSWHTQLFHSFPLSSLTDSSTYRDAISLSRAYWADLFSERPVTLQKVDLTARMLEGAAAVSYTHLTLPTKRIV